jgi:hypothetical protein
LRICPQPGSRNQKNSSQGNTYDEVLASVCAGSATVGEIATEVVFTCEQSGLSKPVPRKPPGDRRPYRGGRSKDWIKVKNRNHPAMDRVMGSFS